MNWGNLESGLLGAIAGGIIGSILSYVGAAYLQNRERKTRQLAAARALLVELRANHFGVQSLGTDLHQKVPNEWPRFEKSDYFVKSAWVDLLPLISPLLHWSELTQIENAYRSMETALQEIQAAGHHVAKSSPTSEWGSFRQDLQRIENQSLRKALHAFAQATKLLASRVLTVEERKEIASQPGL